MSAAALPDPNMLGPHTPGPDNPSPDAPEPVRIVLRPAPDSRPAAPTSHPEVRPLLPADQPQLPFGVAPAGSDLTPPTADGEVTPVADARQWSATLAVAIFETLYGRRPAGQLTRWVDDRVQAVIAFHRRRSSAVTQSRPAILRSIRVQYPRPDAVEVTAHLGLAGRSHALALRLEVWGGHWLCTAVEFAPLTTG
jgi:hypothetical protein